MNRIMCMHAMQTPKSSLFASRPVSLCFAFERDFSYYRVKNTSCCFAVIFESWKNFNWTGHVCVCLLRLISSSGTFFRSQTFLLFKNNLLPLFGHDILNSYLSFRFNGRIFSTIRFITFFFHSLSALMVITN